jgi:hypothetical protein
MIDANWNGQNGMKQIRPKHIPVQPTTYIVINCQECAKNTKTAIAIQLGKMSNELIESARILEFKTTLQSILQKIGINDRLNKCPRDPGSTTVIIQAMHSYRIYGAVQLV